MSDRVIFHTRDRATPSEALSSGASGFYFQVKTTTPSDTSFYGLEVPNLEVQNSTTPSIAKWAWRVRYWTLETDAAASAGGDSDNYSIGELPTVLPINSELEMLTVNNGLRTYTQASGDPTFTFNLFTTPPGEQGVWYDGTNYRPAFYVQGVITLDDFGGNSVAFKFSTYPDFFFPSSPLGSITAQIDGIDVTLYYFAATTGDGAFTLTSLTLTPTTFWAFAATDASPIYDTATGLWLQDPRN